MHLQNAQDNLLPLLDLFTYAIKENKEIILTEILIDLICSWTQLMLITHRHAPVCPLARGLRDSAFKIFK